LGRQKRRTSERDGDIVQFARGRERAVFSPVLRHDRGCVGTI